MGKVRKNRGVVVGIFVVLAVAVLGIAGYTYKHNRNTTPVVTQAATPAVQEKVITYQGEDGKTAYELLKGKYDVVADTSSFGVMVKSINGLANTDKEFWLYSVNGKSADIGADKYFTKSGDEVKWEYKGF